MAVPTPGLVVIAANLVEVIYSAPVADSLQAVVMAMSCSIQHTHECSNNQLRARRFFDNRRGRAMSSNVFGRISRMDHKGNAETLKSLANRYAISLAETEVDHRC